MDRCTFTRQQIIAYINGELSPRQRRVVSQHVDQCATCYALYRYERDHAARLSSELHLLGRARRPDLDRLWSHVQQQIHPSVRFGVDQRVWQYSLLAAALILVCALPWLSLARWVNVGHGVITAVIPAELTPDGTRSVRGQSVALIAETATVNPQPPTPTSTPAAAPMPEVTPFGQSHVSNISND